MVVKPMDKPAELKGSGLKAELELINERATEGNWSESSYIHKRKEFAKASQVKYEDTIKLVPLLKF